MIKGHHFRTLTIVLDLEINQNFTIICKFKKKITIKLKKSSKKFINVA